MDLFEWKQKIQNGAPGYYPVFFEALGKLERGNRRAWGLNLMRELCLKITNNEDPGGLPDDAELLLEGMRYVTKSLSSQMKRKAIRYVKFMLESEPRLQHVRRAFPLCLRTTVDPITRQSQLVWEDMIPRKIQGTWVADVMKKILEHPISSNWQTSKTAYETIKMIHQFLTTVGLLDHESVEDFEAALFKLSPDEVKTHCKVFNERFCSTPSRVKQYCRVQNIIFHHVWVVLTQAMKPVGNRKRVRSMSDLDDALSEKSVQAPGDSNTEVLFLTEDQTKMLIEACGNSVQKTLIIKLLLTTGLRRKGIVNIRIKDVASWNDQQDLWVVDKAGTTLEKGRKQRSFPLYPDVQALLDKWLNGGGLDCRKKSPSRYLFPSCKTNNGQMSVESLQHVFRRVCQVAKLPKKLCHLHIMRHTCAHRLLDEGNNARQIGAYLGHCSSKTTEKFYLRDSVENITSSMKKPSSWTQSSNIDSTQGSAFHEVAESSNSRDKGKSKIKVPDNQNTNGATVAVPKTQDRPPPPKKRPSPSLDVLKQVIRIQEERNRLIKEKNS